MNRLAIVCVVLDEFPFTSIAASRSPDDPYSWCLSRDRSHSQRRDSVVSTIARTPPPAFLFPNQRCQRPDRLSPTPPISPGGGRRRLSSCRPFGCQSVLSDFFAALRSLRKGPGNRRKNHSGATRGSPHKVRSDSIELREDSRFLAKIKWLSPARFSRRRDPVFPREAAI